MIAPHGARSVLRGLNVHEVQVGETSRSATRWYASCMPRTSSSACRGGARRRPSATSWKGSTSPATRTSSSRCRARAARRRAAPDLGLGPDARPGAPGPGGGGPHAAAPAAAARRPDPLGDLPAVRADAPARRAPDRAGQEVRARGRARGARGARRRAEHRHRRSSRLEAAVYEGSGARARLPPLSLVPGRTDHDRRDGRRDRRDAARASPRPRGQPLSGRRPRVRGVRRTGDRLRRAARARRRARLHEL